MNEPVITADRRKVRLGLGLIGVVFVASVVLFFVINDTLGRAVFFGVAFVLLVRMILLVRWLRNPDRQSSTRA